MHIGIRKREWEMILKTIQKDLYKNKGTHSLPFKYYRMRHHSLQNPTHTTRNTLNFKIHNKKLINAQKNYLKYILFRLI